ncbi:DUF3962 domain-containing protein [Ktedonobacteria bacterium brp13]|nr:DUF3962 domain-containing protein [Ktedonobacteria bacterium brp13]
MSKKPIQLVACTIRPGSCLRNLSFMQLSFPDEWFEPLQALQEERSDRLDQPITIPIRSLNAVLQALIPYLLAVPNAVRRSREGGPEEELDSRLRERLPWLLVRQAIPVDRLWYIIQAWFQETYGECESFLAMEHLLTQDDLSWKPVMLSLQEKTYENGTADMAKIAFKVIPAVVADMLVEHRVSLPIHGTKRTLVRVPLAEGAELMTWPPVYFVDKNDEEKIPYGYSYTVNITLQTLVGHAEPRIHFHYGVRRWQSKSCFNGSKLYLKRRTSVYFRPAKAWYMNPYEKNTSGFTIATIEAMKESEEQRFPLWTNLLPNIAKRVNVAVPSADELTKNPLAWLEGTEQVEAGIVCSSSSRHRVGIGLGPDVCEAITLELMAALSKDLILCPPCKPYAIPHKETKHSLMEDLRDLSAEERLAALEKSVGPQVTIEVRWHTESVRDMLVDRIVALLTKPRPPLLDAPDAPSINKKLKGMMENDGEEEVLFEDDISEEAQQLLENGENVLSSTSHRPARKRAPESLPQPAPEQQVISLPDGGQLHIITVPLEGLDSPLPKPDKKGKQTKLSHTNERAKKIREQVCPAKMPTLTLIELPNYRSPKLRKHFSQRDPKHALRLGMAHVGRVTQFITSDIKNLRERCESTVRDGLRQLGYLPCSIGFAMSHLDVPHPLIVVGIWFIRITRRRAAVGVHLPVVVMLHTEHHQVCVWLPHDGRIRSYYQALLDIVHLNPEQVKRLKREDALNQVRHFLLRDLAKQGTDDIVVFTMAQNARSTWNGLYNTETLFDAVRFERGELPFQTKNLPVNLRLIRLRTNMRGETPEWYVPGSLPSTTAQGLWVEHDADERNRLFYSIAGKPHTLTKKYVGKQHKPQENYRISTIVETLPVVLPEGDNPALWAIAADQWRRMGFLTNDMTLLPLPLELARKMDEYAAVIGPWVFPGEWNEDNEEEDNEEEDNEEEDNEEEDNEEEDEVEVSPSEKSDA